MSGDQFTNARPYFDVTFPSSGDAFAISRFRNAFAALGFLDIIPLQPRAHSPADLKIMVRGQDASAFYNPVYYGNADQRTPIASGDTTAFSLPASNPRIDIVYITPSGTLLIKQGTEAASPTLPSLGPSGDSRFPIAAIFCKPAMTAIQNFEDKDSHSGDGYIYKDLRPWMRTAGAGSTSLGNTTPKSVTGDGQATAGVLTTAAPMDHIHAGVHGIRKPGSALLQGDVELYSPDLVQGLSRLSWGMGFKAFAVFDGTAVNPITPASQFGVNGNITKTATGRYAINFVTAFATANYVPMGMCQFNSGSSNDVFIEIDSTGGLTTTQANIKTVNGAGTPIDSPIVGIAFLGF